MSQDIYPPGTSTVTVSGTVDTELPTAAALADNSANPTTPLVGSCLMVWDGAAWDRWDGAVSASGTFDAAGPDAHDAAVSGNPVLMAGYASAAAPAAVSADGDAVRLWASRTGVLQVGDGGGSITVDNGGTFAVQAAQSGTWNVRLYDSGGVAVATTTGTPTGIENAVIVKNVPSGTQTVSIATGSNAIGKLAANSGVDIGDVDVTSVANVVPGTGATNLGKAEDAAHTSGDVGVMALAVYKTSATLLVGSDGDYTPLTVDASGQARVVVGNISSLATLADGTSNPNTGGVAAFQMVWNGSTWDRAPGSASAGLTVNTELPAAAALADSTSNPTAPAVGAFPHLCNGSTWDRQVATLTGTALTATGATTTQNGSDITTYGCRGVILFFNVTAYSGGSGLFVYWQAKDPVSGNYTIMGDAVTAVTGTGIYAYVYYPGANTRYVSSPPLSGAVAYYSGDPIGRTGRVQVQHVGTNATYTVGYCLLN